MGMCVAQASMTYALELKKLIVGMKPRRHLFDHDQNQAARDLGHGGGVSQWRWPVGPGGKAWGSGLADAGGKVRDKILLYADTTSSTNAEENGQSPA